MADTATERKSRGKRGDCRQWRKQGAECVAGVGVQRSRAVGKAHTGHPNRTANTERCLWQVSFEKYEQPLSLLFRERGIVFCVFA